jgi:DNA-binding Xre family transcriptional regulator
MLKRICFALSCDIGDIAEMIPDGQAGTEAEWQSNMLHT